MKIVRVSVSQGYCITKLVVSFVCRMKIGEIDRSQRNTVYRVLLGTVQR